MCVLNKRTDQYVVEVCTVCVRNDQSICLRVYIVVTDIVFLYTAYAITRLVIVGAPHLVQPLSSAGNFKS